MAAFRKPVYALAGYTTVFYGPGRPEFNPGKPMPPFEGYLTETAKGTMEQAGGAAADEGILANFMAPRFIQQGNLPGFLPFMVPSLRNKPCTGVEGACGSGGRAIHAAIKSILSDTADVVFVGGFEVQNTMRAVYGADVLAGAAYYRGERKEGHAYFFPGIFADRAGAYYKKYGYDETRLAMARWYEQSILNARKNPKAQEYYNDTDDLLALAMTPPDPKRFIPHLNLYDCSKVSDGASSLLIVSEEGLKRCGRRRDEAIEIVACVGAEGDITRPPDDLTRLDTTATAACRLFDEAGIGKEDIGILELHDCFTITALLALEALGFAKPGGAAELVAAGETRSDGSIPTNLSGGLGGFGHPTGATGVRQLMDLHKQLTGIADNQAAIKKDYGLMISMGGNDKTVTALVARRA